MSGDVVPRSLPPIADNGCRRGALGGPWSHAPCRVSAATRYRAEGETIGGRRALLACRDEVDKPSFSSFSIKESNDSSHDYDYDIEHNIQGVRTLYRKQESRSQYYFGTVILMITLSTMGTSRSLFEDPPSRTKPEAGRRGLMHEHVPTKEVAGTLELVPNEEDAEGLEDEVVSFQDEVISFQDAAAKELMLEMNAEVHRRTEAVDEKPVVKVHRQRELLKIEALLESLELEEELFQSDLIAFIP